MRAIFLLLLLFAAMGVKAQLFMPDSYADYLQSRQMQQSRPVTFGNNKKWFVTQSAGLTTGFTFFNGAATSYVAVPVNISLNRKLTNNLYAFAGVTAAPVYGSFSHAFVQGSAGKYGNSYMQTVNPGVYGRAELGLRYINDDGSFSISGSIGVERTSSYGGYPVYPYAGSNRR